MIRYALARRPLVAIAISMVMGAASAQSLDWKELLKGAAGQAAGQGAGNSGDGRGVDALSPTDMNAGLKEALASGADAAVAQLGRRDGFFGDTALRIPMPPALQRVEQAMRMVGMGGQADELVLSMNRAAEAAVPQARELLVEAVRQMTLEDARAILTGGPTSATDFFRRKTQPQLIERFSPMVKRQTDRVGLAQQYNQYAGAAARFGIVQKEQASVEDYVTQQAVDRLYTVIGQKEAALRANPMQSGSALLQRVFGAVGGR